MHEGKPGEGVGAGASAPHASDTVGGTVGGTAGEPLTGAEANRTLPIGLSVLVILATVGMAVRTGGAHTRAAPGEEPPVRDVIVVAIDGIAPGDVDLGTTPHLVAFGGDAVSYRDAYAPSPWAAESLDALLHGRHRPPAPGTDGWTPGLADELGHLGYRTALVPGHRRHALGAVGEGGGAASAPAGFQELVLPAGLDGDAGAQGAEVVEAALEWFHASDEPCLLVVTLADPRAPHHHYRGSEIAPDPEYRGPVRSGLPHDDLLRLGPDLEAADLAQLDAFHRTELAATDAALRVLLEGVRRSRGPSPVVAVLGLRQSPMGEGGRLGLIPSMEPEDLRVPVWLQLPSPEEGHVNGSLRGVVGAPISLLDLEPTLLAAIGITPRRDLDGACVHPGAHLPDRPIRAVTSRGVCAAVAFEGDRAVILEAEPPSARVRVRGPRADQRREGRWDPTEAVTGPDADLRRSLARWMAAAGVRTPSGMPVALEDAPFAP